MNQEVIPRIHQIVEFQELKLMHLLSILGDIYTSEGRLSRIVILTTHDRTAKTLAAQLTQQNVSVSSVCGSRKPRRKRRATDGFNGGRFQVLIVSRSGLDTETGEILHFINFDMELPYPLNLARGFRVRNRRHG